MLNVNSYLHLTIEEEIAALQGNYSLIYNYCCSEYCSEEEANEAAYVLEAIEGKIRAYIDEYYH